MNKSLNIVITGGNSGIGLETARALYLDGHHVIIGSRNEEKNQEAVRSIKASGKSSGFVESFKLDLAKRASIEGFFKEVSSLFENIDILINNAGLLMNTKELSELNIEMTMTVNHFGPFYLTYLLFPLLKKSSEARIINVSSTAHYSAKAGVSQNLAWDNESFTFFGQYSKSKLANVLFTRGLAEKLKGYPNIKTASLHPGVVDTGFGEDSRFVKIFKCCCCCILKDQETGARTSLFLARATLQDIRNGEYYDSDTRWKEMNEVARNPKQVWDLWEASEKAYKIQFKP